MSMLDWLDEQLGRITMYSLVLYGLIALSAMALLLMAVGNLDYNPLQFVLSTALLGCVSYGANKLFGWLFGLRPHSESAWITALILALLFTPPTTLIGFVKLALVAVIAMASKYVIAPRGRHMFNPAAIAIVIASIGGIAYAGWWVATAAMVPLMFIVGFLILRRTKKYYVALLFVLVAVVSLLLRGTDIVTALVSWPLLFVAAIMLTEPLTLPPRAWQQYVVAATVGLLMTLPLHYGRVTMTPALALVIGNVIGWWFGKRRAIKLRYVGKKQMNSTVYEFTFDTDKLQFEPGQYIELSLIHPKSDLRGHRRIFSIVGSSGSEQLSIGTKIPTKPSSYKRALMNIKPGTTLYATRVAGDFVLPDDPNVPIVCIAGGIGVTPFVSFCMATDRKIKLIYGVSSVQELSFVQQLRHSANDVTVVSRGRASLPETEWKFVEGTLDQTVLEKLIDTSTQPVVYISGPPAMVASTRRIVKALGIKHIKVDEFVGY